MAAASAAQPAVLPPPRGTLPPLRPGKPPRTAGFRRAKRPQEVPGRCGGYPLHGPLGGEQTPSCPGPHARELSEGVQRRHYEWERPHAYPHSHCYSPSSSARGGGRAPSTHLVPARLSGRVLSRVPLPRAPAGSPELPCQSSHSPFFQACRHSERVARRLRPRGRPSAALRVAPKSRREEKAAPGDEAGGSPLYRPAPGCKHSAQKTFCFRGF